MAFYGKIPVSFSVAWTEEKAFWIAPCPYAFGKAAVHQQDAPGIGKPTFAKPHMNRQRKSIREGLCDICAKPVRVKTKVSFSEERWVDVQGQSMPLVIEPLCCRECAVIAIEHCPHLKRRIGEGAIVVRQVFKYRVVASMLTGAATLEFCGADAPGTIGHLKMELTNYKDRNLEWLTNGGK